MQEIFEKIKERLENEVQYQQQKAHLLSKTYKVSGKQARLKMAECYEHAIEIVNQVAEEYKHGHFGCNFNGQHEKCVDCGLRGECSHCNTEWFDVPDKNVGEIDEVCEWKRDNDEFDIYDTKCKNRHVFFEGSPIDNEYEYCPYCGKELKVVE